MSLQNTSPAIRLRKVAWLWATVILGEVLAICGTLFFDSTFLKFAFLTPALAALLATLWLLFGMGSNSTGASAKKHDGDDLTMMELLKQEVAKLQVELEECEYRARTEADRSKESLEFAEYAGRRFQSLFQGLPVACFTVDCDGLIHEWNRYAEMMFGLQGHEVFLQSVFETLPAFSRDIIEVGKSAIDRALQGEDAFEEERSFFTPDGEEHWIVCNAFPFRDRRGRIVGALCASFDISARKKAEQQSSLAKEQIRSILEAAGDPIISINSEGLILSFNAAAETCFGYTQEEVIGQNVSILMPKSYASKHDKYVLQAVSMPHRTKVIGTTRDLVGQRKDGTEFPVEISLRKGMSGGEVFFTGVLRDITSRCEMEKQIEEHAIQVNNMVLKLEMQTMELEEANRQLSALATTDGLTGLMNHRTFRERLNQELEASDGDSSLWMALMDIDHFKSFNDTFGHQAGDEVLRAVARSLEQTVGIDGVVARYGGEEFAILLSGMNQSEAMEMAELVRVAVECTPCEYKQITISAGLANMTAARSKAEEIVEAADQALYASKRNGRNRVTLYSEDISEAA